MKASNTALKKENDKLKDMKDTFEDEISKLKQAINDQNENMDILNEKIESLEKEKKDISESKDLLMIKIQDIQNRNDDKKENVTSNSNSNSSRSNSNLSLADTQTQMEIYWSDSCRFKSLYLCSCKVDINGKDMSFRKWLDTNINDGAMKLLWAKIDADRCNAAKLSGLLTMAVIIYKTKCYQERTKSKNKPNIDTKRMKQYVEHLSVWIIRHNGIQTNDKRKVRVKLDNGDIREEEVFKWKLSMSRDEFSSSISDWVDSYVEDQGNIENVI